MSKKNKPDTRGFIYSTNPDFKFEEENEIAETLSPEKQLLKVKLDSKQRAGKTVTLINGFVGTDEDLNTLCEKLKNHVAQVVRLKKIILLFKEIKKKKCFNF